MLKLELAASAAKAEVGAAPRLCAEIVYDLQRRLAAAPREGLVAVEVRPYAPARTVRKGET